MSGTSEAVNVRLLDREYTVGVSADGRESLMAAARILDERMREVRGSNRMAAVDRVAVLAALNLAHELQQLREEVATAIGGTGGQRSRLDSDISRLLIELRALRRRPVLEQAPAEATRPRLRPPLATRPVTAKRDSA